MKTLIMAGGYATRLMPLTENRAKPLLPVAGKPIIDYIIEKIPYNDIIVSTNEKFKRDFEAWKSKIDRNIDLFIEKTRKEEEKLGTVGAINYLIKKKKIDEDLLVIAGDNILEFSLNEFIKSYNNNPLIALYDMKNKEKVKRRYGVALVEGRKVVGFQEKPEKPRSTLVSVGCYIYPKDVLPFFTEFLKKTEKKKDAPGYFNEWLCKRKEMDCFIFHGDWYDIGDRESYIKANMDYHGKVYIGKNSEIVNSKIENSVILENSKIIDSSVRGCVIDRNSELQGVDIEDCIIGEGTKIRKC